MDVVLEYLSSEPMALVIIAVVLGISAIGSLYEYNKNKER